MKRDETSRFAVPYLGPQSFQAEDGELFFGRDREAEQLIATILSSRCALLHARSGAGKTSLLNAVVIPRLEARGHTPIRILPQNDPIESVRVATLQYLLPPPSAERAALERALEALDLEHGASLGELLRRFDALGEMADGAGAQETRRRLTAPIEDKAGPSHDVLPISGFVMPYVCRLLRSSVEIAAFGAQLSSISPRAVAGAGLADGGVRAETPLGTIYDLLSRPDIEADHADLVDSLYLPVPGLRPFFENLVEIHGHRTRPGFRKLSLVLIFDQFEELFTRFVDRGAPGRSGSGEAPHWRLRWFFFQQLEELYGEGEHGSLLPIRQVISIRNEYVAQLDPIRGFVPELGRSTFHLEFLGKDGARKAIREPAARYGVSYSPECVEQIVDQLSREERYVEPPYVQIICDRLWRKRGHGLMAGHAHDEIGLEDFQSLGEVEGILDRFFKEFLKSLADPGERLETLEILERLITAGGTRNIVAHDELTAAPFRRPERREELLTRLQNGNVVRIERRVGARFVEITHEFLIEPIRAAIHSKLTHDPDYQEFRKALGDLERVKTRDLRAERRELLSPEALECLETHEERLRWGYLGTEAMLRGTLLAGGDHAALKRWCRKFGEGEAPWNAERTLESQAELGHKGWLLALDELEAVRAAVDAGELDPTQFPPQQRELVLRSVLALATDEEREEVVRWTREVMRDGT